MRPTRIIREFPISSAKAKRVLFAKAGNRCSFPDCGTILISDGILIGQICHIESFSKGGPRYNPEKTNKELGSLDNLIALCPNHHKLIDTQPFIYTAEWLRRAKELHEKKIEEAGADSSLVSFKLNKLSPVSFQEALSIWEHSKSNGDEEFWQTFFHENPKILAQAVPNQLILLGQKCYLGGKSISNKGGNVIDFLFATNSNRNVVLIEIKTPRTKLIGNQYRSNAYAITEELSGSVVQILNYRDELMKNYYSLCKEEGSLQFSAFNPQCLIIAGNLNHENLNSLQQKSLDLYRSNSNVVGIITYDELFGKVSDLVDIIGAM